MEKQVNQEEVDKLKAELQAELDAIEALDEEDPVAELKQQLEDAKKDRANKEKIKELVATHGAIDKKIAVVEIESTKDIVVVKAPEAATFKKYLDSNNTQTSQDNEKLVQPCVIYPSLANYNNLLSKNPAIIIELSGAVQRLAGFRAEKYKKK